MVIWSSTWNRKGQCEHYMHARGLAYIFDMNWETSKKKTQKNKKTKNKKGVVSVYKCTSTIKLQTGTFLRQYSQLGRLKVYHVLATSINFLFSNSASPQSWRACTIINATDMSRILPPDSLRHGVPSREGICAQRLGCQEHSIGWGQGLQGREFSGSIYASFIFAE